MVRSIAIDPGDRVVKVVALDGSYRKTRLLHVHTAPVGAAGDDPMRPDIVAEIAREAIDGVAGGGAMKGEIALGHPCREAVLRSLELPFKGTDAIKKVVKAEIEGEIYTHSVDDMVVDFHEIGVGASGGTRILVASVPKLGLRNQLASLSAQGIDPEVVDLDTMALWRAADWVGAFEVEADDDDVAIGNEGTPVNVVVDLGARSIKAILVEGDKLVEMRALRLGDSTVVEHIAREYGLPFEDARDAVERSLQSGGDIEVAFTPELPALADGEPGVEGAALLADVGAAATPAAVAEGGVVLVAHANVEVAQTKYLQRVARELTRFMTASGMAARVRTVWTTGGASRGQGINEMLTAVFGVEPREIDVLSHLQHNLDADEAAELSPLLATAVGLALGRLGGPEGFQMRQEDLSLTRGFERIKFPLAIACMVALLALFVHANRRSTELKNLELEIGQRYYDPNDPKAVSFHGLLYPVFQSWFKNDRYFRLESKGSRKDYKFRDLVDEVSAAPVPDRIHIVHERLKAVAAQKQKKSGVYEDVSLESGFAVLVRWAEMMKAVEPQLGRYLVTRLAINMKAPNRWLEFTVAFRTEDFRARMSTLERAIEAEYAKPDSPFTAPKNVGDLFKPEPFKDAQEKDVSGSYYKVKIPIKEVFLPFGPSSRSIGAASVPRWSLAPDPLGDPSETGGKSITEVAATQPVSTPKPASKQPASKQQEVR